MVIGGFTDPAGSRLGLGALLVGYYQGSHLRYAGKVGTASGRDVLVDLRPRLDDLEEDRPAFSNARPIPERGVHRVRPELVAQVAFTEWTTDGKLPHPRYQGLRTDKQPAGVVRERPAGSLHG